MIVLRFDIVESTRISLELTALVVDDNQINRQVFTRLLMKNGFKCFGAANGQEAIKKLEENPNQIHVILLDMFVF